MIPLIKTKKDVVKYFIERFFDIYENSFLKYEINELNISKIQKSIPDISPDILLVLKRNCSLRPYTLKGIERLLRKILDKKYHYIIPNLLNGLHLDFNKKYVDLIFEKLGMKRWCGASECEYILNYISDNRKSPTSNFCIHYEHYNNYINTKNQNRINNWLFILTIITTGVGLIQVIQHF